MQDTELYTMILGLKLPWKVVRVVLNLDVGRVDVWTEEDPNWKWKCPVCGKPAPVYDHSEEQTWRHLDTCQYQTHLHARLVRTNCPEHGVKQVPAAWAGPRSRFTLLFESHMIDTLKECDTQGATRLLGTRWDETWSVVERAVARGQARKTRRVPEYLSIDEKAFAKRHKYETVVCDLTEGTVEYVIDDRRQASLESYFKQFTKDELSGIRAVAMDMWDPFIAATKAHVPQASDKIVFDRFHVTRYVTEAVDKVRKQESKVLLESGDERLQGTRYLWLTNFENLSEQRQHDFDAVRWAELKTGRAWSLKETLRPLWRYRQEWRAHAYFQRWYYWATHSRLSPMVAAAKTLKHHLKNILTYFKHRITNAVAEGLNSKIQMVKEMACGFRNREHYKTAIYFHCGGLDLYPHLETA
jgi:transposase